MTAGFWVFDLEGTTPQSPALTLGLAGDDSYSLEYFQNFHFGRSLAIGDRWLAVGISIRENEVTVRGEVQVFDLLSAQPDSPWLILPAPPASSEAYGSKLSMSGSRLLVSDPQAGGAGRIHVYDLGGSAPQQPVLTVENPSPAAGDEFGGAVALDGTVIVAGAAQDDTVARQKGHAYVFAMQPDLDGDGLLDTWENLWWPELGGQRADHDSDGDGLENLLEMAFGMNPNRADNQALPIPTLSEGRLTMMITKRPGVRYEVQSAGTLLPGQSQSFSKASTVVLMDDASSLQVRDDPPALGANMRFMRVHVRPQP